MKNAGKLSTVMIAVFSLVLVFGALLTALAETGFTAEIPTKAPEQNDTGKPTVTTIILPTTAEEPSKVPPTVIPEKTDPPEKTSEPTKTATVIAVATKTTSTPEGGCTKPTDWVDYKVKSGDTLFGIATLYQTEVDTIKTGNCIGSSNQIITGQVLWVPNNAPLSPTKTPKPTATQKPEPTSDGCHVLTLTHLGSGADPTASPTNSTGCAAGKYKDGETITLTASPTSGWLVGSWYGTNNNSSTALTNTVTMPNKDHMAKPIYNICSPLTISTSTNGSDPVPDKANSSVCSAGEYINGEKITFSATPDPGYTIDSWIGTDSGTNKLTMPTSAATVGVSYQLIPPVCFALTLSTSGTGSVLTPNIANSSGCSSGEYVAGETISLTSASGTVTGWTGTDDDSSTASTNTVTMPASVHTAGVIYSP